MFADKVKELTREKGVTPKQVCDAVGVGEACYGLWITRGSIPYNQNLRALAKFFGVSVTDLLDGSKPRHGRRVSDLDENAFFDTSRPAVTVREKLELLAYYRGIEVEAIPSICTISIVGLRSLLRGETSHLDLYQSVADGFHVPVWTLLCSEPLDSDTLHTKDAMRHNIKFVGTNLKYIRAMKGMSSKLFCGPLEISAVSLKNYETGRTSCPVKVMQKACDVWGISAKDITESLPSSEFLHSWFTTQDLHTRLCYFQAIRDISMRRLSVNSGHGPNYLDQLYNRGAIKEGDIARVAELLCVPAEWLWKQDIQIEPGTEIK